MVNDLSVVASAVYEVNIVVGVKEMVDVYSFSSGGEKNGRDV